MRYLPGQPIPAQIQPIMTDDTFIFAAILGLLIGVILTYLARKGKQAWLLTWSVGLIISSVFYLGFIIAT